MFASVPLLAVVLALGEGSDTDPSALYKEAGRLRATGDLAGASRAYRRAHELLRASDFDHGNVADSLLESVGLAIDAQDRNPDASLLCEARRLVAEYETAILARSASTGPEISHLRERVEAALQRSGASCQLVDETPVAPPPGSTVPDAETRPPDAPLGPKAAEPPPPPPEGPVPPTSAPPPARRQAPRMEFAGYAGLGLAGLGAVLLAVGVGLGEHYERVGEDDVLSGVNADWLQEHVLSYGKTANNLAMAGAVITSIGAATAVTLLVMARRKPQNRIHAHLTYGGVRF